MVQQCNIEHALNFSFMSGKHGNVIFLRVGRYHDLAPFKRLQRRRDTLYVDFFNIFPSHAVLSLRCRSLHAYFAAESIYVYLCEHIYRRKNTALRVARPFTLGELVVYRTRIAPMASERWNV